VAKTETVRARIEPELKRDAEAVLSELGLSTSEAITLFLRQVTLRRGLPFRVHIPNAETRTAIAEARDRTDLETYDTVEEWSDEVRGL
jgi:DNA-damage-inducible protein J